MSFRLIPRLITKSFFNFHVLIYSSIFHKSLSYSSHAGIFGKYTSSSQTECSYFAHCPHDVCPSDFQSVDAKDIILAHTRRTQPSFLCVRLISFINVFCLMSSNHLFETWINFFRPLKFVPSQIVTPNIFVEIFLCGFSKQ